MNTDDLIRFLVLRIVALGRLRSAATSPTYRSFWTSQLETYHANLKNVLTGGVK